MTAATDVIPDTPTARALSGRTDDSDRLTIEASECKPKKYITVDPDDPNAPTCSGKRYIIAPDPARRGMAEVPEWARAFGDSLAESKR